MKRIYSSFLVLLTAFLVQTTVARSSRAQSKPEQMMYTSSVVSTTEFGHMATSVLRRVPLDKVLKEVEKKYDATFIYEYSSVRDKYVNYSGTFLTRETGEKLAQVLADLGLSYVRLDKETYVLFPKERQKKKIRSIQFTVTGKVTDASTKEALPGVNVLVKGTTSGTATDVNGNYTLNVPSANDTLIFSYIGYQHKVVPIDGKNVINVSLVQRAISGQQLVVVGYGTQSQATLTASVGKVSGDEISKNPSPNVTSSLEGQIPGLTINSRSGEPGRDNPDILIRGTGTFLSPSNTDPNKTVFTVNAPLILVDGMPQSEDIMSRLNPEVIKSISVLKGASAAIYGARAANGVILITTKQGKAGKSRFDVSYSTSFQSLTQIPKVLDAATFAQAYDEGEWYRAGRPPMDQFTPTYPAAVIQKYKDGSDPVLYPNTNWVKEVVKPYTLQQHLNFQASGGTEKVRYLLSFGMINQDGNFKNNPTHYKQYNARIKVGADLTKNFTVSANIYTIISNQAHTPIATGVNLINILQAPPTEVAIYPNGLIAPGRLGENPLLLDQRGFDKIHDYPVNSTFKATYEVPWIQGLKVDASFNYDLRNQDETSFSTPYYYYQYNVNTKQYDKTEGTGQSTIELTDTHRKWTSWLANLRVTYERTFLGNHHVTAMVGTEQQKNTYNWIDAYRKNFVSSAIPQINIGSNAPADKDNGGSASASAYNNYFGRLNYDFKSKYLFQFSFRYDGSQIFPKGKRYGFFPAVSAGWRLSETKFFRDHLPFVSELKLRGSWGELGNDRVDPYQYLQAYSFGDNYVFGGKDVTGIYANTAPNPDITWEVSKKTDLGLDASLWNGLLGFELTLWQERRSNILVPANQSVPNTFGFPGLPDENIGKVNNHGFEVTLSHKNTVGALFYSLAGNVAFARSKIIYMNETPQAEPYQDLTGHPIGAALYYKADGIFHTQQELDNYPHGAGAQVGDIKVVDVNGDGVIDSKDQIVENFSATPELTFGLNSNFRYKNFDLSLFFSGQADAYVYSPIMTTLGGNDFRNTVTYRANNRWTIDNPNGTMPRSDAWTPGATTFFLYNDTFIRLKTAELGYSLPDKLISRGGLRSVRFYVNASNLLTWAYKIKWMDPETTENYNAGTPPYPPQRIINLGVDVKF